jgi:uncharacterized protein
MVAVMRLGRARSARASRLAAWVLLAGVLALAPGRACLAGGAAGEAGDLPELTQPVNDFAGVVDAANSAEMDRMIRALQRATGDAVVVATVNSLDPYGDIHQYAVKLFENHGKGIGEKDKHNGLLILLAVKDRKVRIEVGYALEEFVTDGYAGETSRQYMIPYFRQNDFGGGLRAGVARIVGRLAEARGVALEVDAPARPAQGDRSISGGTVLFFILIVIVILLQMRGGGPGGFVGRRRSWGGSGWSGWNSGIGSFGGGGGGGFGGGFGGFGGGGSSGGGGGGSW